MSSAPNSERVGLGVIGVGLIGARHARMIAQEPSCQLVGIADPSSTAVSLGAELGVPSYASHEALLERADLDGVIVASPTRLHVPIALDCVRRGLPALVEKPIADSVQAGRALVAAANAAGVIIAVGHHRRFAPAVSTARAILQGGEIGRVVAVSGIWALRKPAHYFAEAPWRSEPGGGPLLINLIHDIDLLRYCCGEVETVYAETSNAQRRFEVEDSGALMLRFSSGALGMMTFSDAAPSPWNWESCSGDTPFVPPGTENCYRFVGSAGSLEFPRLAIWRHDSASEGSWTEPIQRAPRNVPPGDALREQLMHFIRVVRGEALTLCPAADALGSLAVVEAARESARAGRPIRIAAI